MTKLALGPSVQVMELEEIIVQVQGFEFLSRKGFKVGMSTRDKDQFSFMQDLFHEVDEPC